MADELLFTQANKIATITLNRPDQLNTFHDGMLADWAAALRECQANDAINVVVLTAAGRVFCAGGDLGTMGRRDGNPAWDMGHYIRQNVHPVARAVDAHVDLAVLVGLVVGRLGQVVAEADVDQASGHGGAELGGHGPGRLGAPRGR